MTIYRKPQFSINKKIEALLLLETTSGLKGGSNTNDNFPTGTIKYLKTPQQFTEYVMIVKCLILPVRSIINSVLVNVAIVADRQMVSSDLHLVRSSSAVTAPSSPAIKRKFGPTADRDRCKRHMWRYNKPLPLHTLTNMIYTRDDSNGKVRNRMLYVRVTVMSHFFNQYSIYGACFKPSHYNLI